MDAFPDYTQFDKQHKVFASIQIIGDENIHPDTDVDEDEEDVTALPIEFTSITGGANGWADQSFPGDTKNVQFSQLGNSYKTVIDGANIDFYGNLNRIDNWKAFSSNAEDLTGYYYPFSIEAEDGAKLIREATLNGASKIITIGQTGDGEGIANVIWAIDPSSPVITAYLESADGSARVEYSFDFSKVVFK